MNDQINASGVASEGTIEPPPASMIRRVIAMVVDGVIWVGLAFACYIAAMYAIYDFKSERGAAVALLIMYLGMPAYFLTEVFARRTLGKRWAGITVVVPGENGKRIRRRLVRWVLKSSPWLMVLLYQSVRGAIENVAIVKFMVETLPQLAERGIGRLLSLDFYAPAADFDWLHFLLEAVFLSVKLIESGLVPFLILGIGTLLAFSPSRRTLLDRLSGTAVCRWDGRSQARGFDLLPATIGAPVTNPSE